jgi:hypothetical protein
MKSLEAIVQSNKNPPAGYHRDDRLGYELWRDISSDERKEIREFIDSLQRITYLSRAGENDLEAHEANDRCTYCGARSADFDKCKDPLCTKGGWL